MYTLIKSVLIVTILFGLSNVNNANQEHKLDAVIPRYSATQVAEANDDDGETNPATEASENTQKLQNQISSSKKAT